MFEIEDRAYILSFRPKGEIFLLKRRSFKISPFGRNDSSTPVFELLKSIVIG